MFALENHEPRFWFMRVFLIGSKLGSFLLIDVCQSKETSVRVPRPLLLERNTYKYLVVDRYSMLVRS